MNYDTIKEEIKDIDITLPAAAGRTGKTVLFHKEIAALDGT